MKDHKRQPTAVRAPAIVKEAVRLFTLNGYDATSVDAIASGVGITKASVYHHFSGKEEILSAAMDLILDPLEQLLADTRLEEMPAIGQLRAIVVSVIELTALHRGEVLLLSMIKSNTQTERSAQERRRKLQATVSKIITRAIEEGSISPFFDPVVLGRLIFGMTNSVMYWWDLNRPSNTVDTQTLLDQILGFISSGVSYSAPAESETAWSIPHTESSRPVDKALRDINE
ncbi:TetR family transcriptional regulator [Paralcaligenes ureilyticus]|uniref:TetR family transcriptional regulator n=2 Tax=Paralcaligenes ureilyticus TaxID=627131 RepID=A0A4R3M527_9BURK|nr:TetR family transcriptional regulator [Paralcaligenes ureilyticus]